MKKDNSGWRVTVEPASDADVTIGFLPALPADDCTEAAVVCTAGGTRLSVGAATYVPGPASLSVADATVTNSIKGLLKLHGIFDLSPRAKQFEAQFADVETAYGAPFPLRARQEIERLKERLSLVERQIAEVEAERDEVARSGAKLSVADALEGSSQQAAAKIATLTQLKGIGENDATLLTHEVFYRGFRNRRELAGWVGITPTPWASGNTERDQGVGRDGPAWIRANLIQMAWRWLRHQPDSALSEWFRGRTAGARGRIRRVMIVALARKLLIALWRFSETGLVPSGVRLA